MSCGELGPIDGGLIKNSTIQNSTVTGSSFTNGLVSASDLEGCSLKGTASVDAASARTIADAMADDQQATREIASALAGDEVAAGELADAILGGAGASSVMQMISNSNPAVLGSPQNASEGDDLPTAVFGVRDALLGKPDAWMKVGDYVLPLYSRRS